MKRKIIEDRNARRFNDGSIVEIVKKKDGGSEKKKTKERSKS